MQMMTDVEEMANPMQTNQRASTWDSQLDKMLDNHASLTTGVWFFRTPSDQSVEDGTNTTGNEWICTKWDAGYGSKILTPVDCLRT